MLKARHQQDLSLLFPIYHKGEGTVHDKTLVPDWDVIFTNNELLLAKKFNLEWYEQHKHLEKKFPATQPKPITEKNDKDRLPPLQ